MLLNLISCKNKQSYIGSFFKMAIQYSYKKYEIIKFIYNIFYFPILMLPLTLPFTFPVKTVNCYYNWLLLILKKDKLLQKQTCNSLLFIFYLPHFCNSCNY